MATSCALGLCFGAYFWKAVLAFSAMNCLCMGPAMLMAKTVVKPLWATWSLRFASVLFLWPACGTCMHAVSVNHMIVVVPMPQPIFCNQLLPLAFFLQGLLIPNLPYFV